MPPLNRIPKDLLIVVCDSHKALFLANAGGEVQPELRIVDHIEAAHAAHAPDSDHAGRRYDGGRSGAGFHTRSAMHTADPDEENAADFAREIDRWIATRQGKDGFATVLVTAPPSFLGTFRSAASSEVRTLVKLEYPKHLTELPVEGIQAALFHF